MNQAALKKTRIIKGLSRIPYNKLDHVQKFVYSMINAEEHSERSGRSLKGIWKGQGFEKIVDLEKEIQEIRTHLGRTILKRPC